MDLQKVKGKKKEAVYIFVDSTKHYLLLSDSDFESITPLSKEISVKDVMQREGYTQMEECFHTFYEAACKIRQRYPELKPVHYTVMPITFKKSCAFVNTHHRNHVASQGCKYAVGVMDATHLVGVAIAGRPVSRRRDNGLTLEITRVCVIPGYKNACSLLYSRVLRIAKEMGYKTAITYTLKKETGSSLKAAGFFLFGESKGGSWNSPSRKRVDVWQEPKVIWKKVL